MRRDKTLILAGVWCCLGLTGTSLAAEGLIRQDIGAYGPGDQVQLDLDQIVPSPDLRLLLNGQDTALVFATRGRRVVIELPDTLRGTRQDITVQRRVGDGFETLGIWSFSSTRAPAIWSGSLLGEAGVRSADGTTRDYGFAGGRVDVDLGDGQTRGALTFLLDEAADPATGDRLRIPDWFVETGRDVGAGRAYARLGSQYLQTAGVLLDGSARRGVQFGFETADRTGQAAVFALGTDTSDSASNLLGLADDDARLTGVRLSGLPFGTTGPKLEFAAFDGRARRDDSTAPGDLRGAELTLGGLITPRVGYALSYAQSAFDGATGQDKGTALTSELTFGLLPQDDARSLVLSVGYDRIEQDFFSPLSQSLIAGEETLALGLSYGSDLWSWDLDLARARTNTGGPASAPVDILDRAALTVSYQPQVFTGGFLNGTTFYGGLEVLTQDRLTTPAGALAATDSTVRRFSLGLDRLQPDFSLAVLYTHDDYLDRSGSSDETLRSLQGLVTLEGYRRLDANIGTRLTHTDGPGTDYWDGALSAGLRLALIENKLDYGLTTGLTLYQDDVQPRGGFVAQELSYGIFDGYDLVMRAEYGFGTDLPQGRTDSGWNFGLAIRADLGILSAK